MTRHLQVFLRGVGSMMDIAPDPDPSRYLPKGTDAQRLRGDLEKISADRHRVMEQEVDGRSGIGHHR